MFENAGTKIKSWAAGLFVIESIVAFISGIVIIVGDSDSFFTGLLVIAGGILAAWVLCLFLSAFGELVESSTENRKINGEILELMKQGAMPAPASVVQKSMTERPAGVSPAAAARQQTGERPLRTPVKAATDPETWNCSNCGTSNSKNYYQCKKCGTQRSGN